MRILLRKLASRVLPRRFALKLKQAEYATKKWRVRHSTPISEEQFRGLLTSELGIRPGDAIFVHASLDMIKTELTRSQIVDLLRECVGPNGTIVVPTFPRAAAVDWMRSADVFDVRRSPSGMGSFSEAVRKQPNSKRSMHPTKSVAAVGPLADTIVARHHLSPYPFGPHSPFYMLIERDVKVIGLGVPMSYLSMVHVVEDCNPETFPVRVNLSQPLSKRCVGTDGNAIEVESFVHDLNVVAKANPEKFCRRYLPAESYRIFKKGPTPFFVVQGRRLYESLTMEMSRGNTIYD